MRLVTLVSNQHATVGRYELSSPTRRFISRFDEFVRRFNALSEWLDYIAALNRGALDRSPTTHGTQCEVTNLARSLD
jgi:hypothetical protein